MIHTRSALKNNINLLLASEKTNLDQRMILCQLMDTLVEHYNKSNPQEHHGYCVVDKSDTTKREYF